MKYEGIKYVIVKTWFLMMGLILVIFSTEATSNDQQVKTMQQSIDVQNQKRKPIKQSIQVQEKKTTIAIDMPVYKPPRRGTPRALVGGGSRGTGTGLSPLSLIVPDHIGLTVKEQPSLYWYLSEPISNRVEFTLIDNLAIQPLLEINIGTQIKSGVHHIRLTDYGVRLTPGRQYWWFVAIVPDPDHRSKDTIAGGAIKYIEPPEALTTRLAQASKVKAPHIYAETGIWYDSLSAISDLIDDTPNDIELRKQRASLMKQVGLEEIAEYEMKPSVTAGD